ncbi:MAG: hypothetical protein RL181_2634 [Bacteroidota bacterium]|jgi:peptidyl-prolyl cis-trans isomerase SurA
MNRLIFAFIGLFFCASVQAQKDDILFTVAGKPVPVSEFDYVYSKTNGKEADFSRNSLQEYLDLYVKFKLKVQRARDMRLDTVTQLRQELDGYRKQLADAYLINKTVTERLVREAHQRSLQDVEISHILFAVAADAPAADTLAAYQKALAAKKTLDAKQGTFPDLAVQLSDDKSAAQNKGRIGFLNVLFPNGFYPLETAAYTMPLNQVSAPIRTTSGYHLLWVHSRRPARGEVEIAHILARKEEGQDPERAKKYIQAIQERLSRGDSFDALAREFSEDRKTSANAGYLGFLGINQVEEGFEDAAFAIPQDGGYSEPFETSIGWHIIKRISRKGPMDYELARTQLEAKIKRDARFELAKTAMLADIKKANGFKEYPEVLNRFAQSVNDTFFTFRWKAPQQGAKDVLFSLGDQKVTLAQFFTYLSDNPRERMRLRDAPVSEALPQVYQLFVDETCMRLEERQLEQKYPEFRLLMREYEEGILLFEATRIEVWDKAAQDTVGLQNYFATIRDKYRWNDRAEVTRYYVEPTHMDQIQAIRAFCAGNSKEAVLEKFNAEDRKVAQAESFMIERDKSPESADVVEWREGEVTRTAVDPNKNNLFYFMKVGKVIPSSPKALSEARGYIVADYQDHLEQQWVESLRKAYEVKINQSVFDKLVRK